MEKTQYENTHMMKHIIHVRQLRLIECAFALMPRQIATTLPQPRAFLHLLIQFMILIILFLIRHHDGCLKQYRHTYTLLILARHIMPMPATTRYMLRYAAITRAAQGFTRVLHTEQDIVHTTRNRLWHMPGNMVGIEYGSHACRADSHGCCHMLCFRDAGAF